MTVERHLQRRFLRKRGAAGIPPQSLLRKASSPKGTPLGYAGNLAATPEAVPLGKVAANVVSRRNGCFPGLQVSG